MKATGMVSYYRFLRQSLHVATDGGWVFYAWMFVLSAIALVGANAWAVQVRDGMIRTNMTDHVSWGLYIANFTFPMADVGKRDAPSYRQTKLSILCPRPSPSAPGRQQAQHL